MLDIQPIKGAIKALLAVMIAFATIVIAASVVGPTSQSLVAEVNAAPSDIIRQFRRVAPPPRVAPTVRPSVRTQIRTPALSRIRPNATIPRQDFHAIRGELRIPNTWAAYQSNAGRRYRGVIFRDPQNPDFNNVRVMPGNTTAQYATQRQPYVVHTKDGWRRDLNGEQVTRHNPEPAHISLESYDFSSLQY